MCLLDKNRACLEIWVNDELVTGLDGRHAPETCTYNQTALYCTFGNVREAFIFAKLRIFVKIKTLRNSKINQSFTDILVAN